MNFSYLAFTASVFFLIGCATVETKSAFLEKQYNLNSRVVYRAVMKVLEEEKMPIGILDSSEPRIITTGFLQSEKLNQEQRHRLKIVIAELSEELTEVKIQSFQEYFDEFWQNEWIPMQPDGKIERELLDKIEARITQGSFAD